jgi:hypothetical protein
MILYYKKRLILSKKHKKPLINGIFREILQYSFIYYHKKKKLTEI